MPVFWRCRFHRNSTHEGRAKTITARLVVSIRQPNILEQPRRVQEVVCQNEFSKMLPCSGKDGTRRASPKRNAQVWRGRLECAFTSEHTNTSPYFSLKKMYHLQTPCIQKYLVLPSWPSVCPIYLSPSKNFTSILRDSCCNSDPTSDAQSALIPSSLCTTYIKKLLNEVVAIQPLSEDGMI